jgi:hypothetical protein
MWGWRPIYTVWFAQVVTSLGTTGVTIEEPSDVTDPILAAVVREYPGLRARPFSFTPEQRRDRMLTWIGNNPEPWAERLAKMMEAGAEWRAANPEAVAGHMAGARDAQGWRQSPEKMAAHLARLRDAAAEWLAANPEAWAERLARARDAAAQREMPNGARWGGADSLSPARKSASKSGCIVRCWPPPPTERGFSIGRKKGGGLGLFMWCVKWCQLLQSMLFFLDDFLEKLELENA